MENAIEVRGLCKRYGSFSLEEVSLAVPRGYISGLVGPNGAGKTTLIRLVMGLARPDRGEVRLFGEDAARHGPRLRSRIGFVSESPMYPDDATVREIASALAPFYGGWDERRFRSLVVELELPLRARFKKLSQGMRSKLGLAVALSHRAELLVLDEPTSGLDPLFRRELLDMLAREIQGGETAVLFSTHITADLDRVADYVTFLRAGRPVFSGPREEVLAPWAIVRGGPEILAPACRGLYRSVRRGTYGVSALTSDAGAARRAAGPGVTVDRATLEDIMVYTEEGTDAAQADA